MKQIGVFSKVPNLIKELKIVLPVLRFTDIYSEKDERLKGTEILIGDPDLFGSIIYELPRIKWIQSTWAGVEKLLEHVDQQKSLPCIITRFSGIHFGRIMGEYVVACIVNKERDMRQIYENQKQRNWDQDGQIGHYRIIHDLKIGILGVGSIGNKVGQILHTLDATVYGFGRSRTLKKLPEYDYLFEYYSSEQLPEFLQKCDYIINVLPSTPDTIGILGNDMLENCKERKAVFINIGRGNVISDADLIRSIGKKWISSAILDVFNTEPLPPNSKLWSMPEVTITPHNSGMSRAKDIAEQFKINFQLYVQNKPIPATWDVRKDY